MFLVTFPLIAQMVICSDRYFIDGFFAFIRKFSLVLLRIPGNTRIDEYLLRKHIDNNCRKIISFKTFPVPKSDLDVKPFQGFILNINLILKALKACREQVL